MIKNPETITVSLQNISKKYQLHSHENQKTKAEHWALKDVSFSLTKGDILGVVGANGSGKTTLLKILSQIIKPSAGECKITGNVLSIIDLGAGFHPDLSGRENVLLASQVILGMPKEEINELMKYIIEFSELEKFIDEPIKTYSNGMYLRLAVSIAFFCPTDILLIDEIFSAGDRSFLVKCYNKIREIIGRFHTVIFASHNLDDIQRICNKCLWLDEGCIKLIGETDEVVSMYTKSKVKSLNNKLIVTESFELKATSSFNDSSTKTQYVDLLSVNVSPPLFSNPNPYIDYNLPFAIKIVYNKIQPDCEIGFSLIFTDDANNPILSVPQYLNLDAHDKPEHALGLIETTCTFPAMILNLGIYSVNLRVLLNRKEKILYLRNVLTFEVVSSLPAQENILKLTPMKMVLTLPWSSKAK